jgi:hypothetical protein
MKKFWTIDTIFEVFAICAWVLLAITDFISGNIGSGLLWLGAVLLSSIVFIITLVNYRKDTKNGGKLEETTIPRDDKTGKDSIG